MAAQAARVVDGDTLELVDAKRIRLWGIDAPEGEQTCQRGGRLWRCGDEASAALGALIDGRELTCVERDIDGYGRIVAICTMDGQDIGSAMVRQGWALDYEPYSGGAYTAEQLEAEQAGAVVRVFPAALGVAGALAGGRCSRLEPFQHRLREHQPLRGRIHVAEPCRGVELALGILQLRGPVLQT